MNRASLTPFRICSLVLLCFGVHLGSISTAQAQSSEQLIARAFKSIRTNQPSAVNDISMLITTLRKSRTMSEQTELIEALREMGDTQGSSPQKIKDYLKDIMPLALLDVLRSRADGRVRGQALMSLRSFGPADDLLDEAIATAEKDSSPDRDYVHEQASLLSQWKRDGKPAVAAPAKAGATDPVRRRNAEEYLRKNDKEVAYFTLADAVAKLDEDEVDALLDAGLRLADVHLPAANQAVAGGLNVACLDESVSPDKIGDILQRLLKQGFRMDIRDENGNELVMNTIQSCPTPVIARLINLGARPDPTNNQNTTPLEMAIISAKWDLARILVDHGAGMSKEQVDRMFMELPEDPEQLDLLKRAMKNKLK
ncbi:MAG: hypothetical protein FWD68_00940 [Alphaproteobacteria bacterium]|nr:hypothetical protein [Alphaproteobacteria bacterium]